MKEILHHKLFSLFDVPISAWKILLTALIVVFAHLLVRFFKAFIYKTLRKREYFDDDRASILHIFARLTVYVLAGLAIIYALDMDSVWKEFLDFKLISSDGEKGINISIRNVLTFFAILFIARLVIRVLLRSLRRYLSTNKSLDEGQRYTIIKMSKYLAFTLTIIIAANSAGVNLNTLLLGSAVFLVGIGFALQHIFDDIISGFIILFEGTFQMGDVIETEGLIAKVIHMDIRTSKVITRDGNIIVVPNRMLTSEKLTNWSHGNEVSRFYVVVGVSYGSDVDQVKKLLYQCALKHPDVSKNKPILIRFDDFAESALEFRLFFWASRSWQVEVLKSDLRFDIYKSFQEHGVVIPFPQRDLHVKGWPSGAAPEQIK